MENNLIEEKVSEEIQKQFGPRNRAERRAEAKKSKQKSKKKKYFIDSLTDYATKLAYIDMIQKVRAKTAELEKENEINGTDNH